MTSWLAKLCFVVSLTLVCCIWVEVADAVHIHALHPTTLHANTWKRIALDVGPGVPVPVVLDSDQDEVLFETTLVNYGCNNSNPTVETSKSVTHSFNVTGVVSYGGAVEAEANILLAKCKALAEANVSLSAGWTGTWTQTITVSDTTTLEPCQGISYRVIKRKKMASGSGFVYDHRIVCKCTCGATATNYCNKTTLNCQATGWASGEIRGWFDPVDLPDCDCDEEEPGLP